MHSGRFLVGITEQMASKLEPSLFQVTLSTGNRLTESNNPLKVFIEGREGVKWELGLALL